MSSPSANKSEVKSTAAPVRKRRVFYIPGYDPIHPRRYRELYRSEAAKQAAISDYEIALAPKQTDAKFGWHVRARIEGVQTETDVEVLMWSDIVKDSMTASIPGTYAQLFRTAWVYISTGALRRLARMRIGPVLAALYPVAMLLAQAVLALVLGFGIYAFVTWVFGFMSPASIAGSPALHRLAGAGAAIWAVMRALRWFHAQDARFMAYYLMHDYAFSAAHRGANPPELEARLSEFRARIEAAMQSDVDEVLLVGHSSGAHLGVSVMADFIRKGGGRADGPALGFLSLGQVVPMVSFLPEAQRLRADLRDLSRSDALAWVDVTAPGDGCAFALCDPVAVSGVAPQEGKRWPLVFSAAFTKSLKPETYKALKRRYFRLHFQYMSAFDQPRDYDYFQITAGPQTLAARYEGRPPSRSRIETPLNAFTSVTP